MFLETTLFYVVHKYLLFHRLHFWSCWSFLFPYKIFLVWWNSMYYMYFYCCLILMLYPRIHYWDQCQENSSTCFLVGVLEFQILSSTLNPFWVNCHVYERIKAKFNFCGYAVALRSCVEDTFSTLGILDILFEHQLSKNAWVHFWVFSSILLPFMLISMLTPWSLSLKYKDGSIYESQSMRYTMLTT